MTRDTGSVHVCCLQAANRVFGNLWTCPESLASLRLVCTPAPMFLTPAAAFLLLPPSILHVTAELRYTNPNLI